MMKNSLNATQTESQAPVNDYSEEIKSTTTSRTFGLEEEDLGTPSLFGKSQEDIMAKSSSSLPYVLANPNMTANEKFALECLLGESIVIPDSAPATRELSVGEQYALDCLLSSSSENEGKEKIRRQGKRRSSFQKMYKRLSRRWTQTGAAPGSPAFPAQA
eukprot:Sro1669_g289910.2  (160) ;mRNA; f:2625-3104